MSPRHIDRGIVFGVAIAVAAVVLGLLLDGGSIRQVLQPTAALIVLGGTLGAVIIQFPSITLLRAARELRGAFFSPGPTSEESMEELLDYCVRIRRNGILSLDAHLEKIEDVFLRKGLTHAVDGLNVRDLRASLEHDMDLHQESEEEIAYVLEAAGGFAPTMGIIGAVLGLIQVMQRMDNITEIGKGIAVAFVSTLYGIAFANICLLPLAGKLRIRVRQRQVVREMTLVALVAIVEGVSARFLRQRLEPYLFQRSRKSRPLPQPDMVGR